MENFIKQDVFFFVTTIAVIVFSGFIIVLMYYLIRISRKVDYITEKAKQEVNLLSGELGELRKSIRRTGVKVSHFSKFVSNVAKKYSKK